MAKKHVMKLTATEAIVKLYSTESAGDVLDIDLQADLTANGQVWANNGASVTITELFWGAKKDKQIDLTRVTDTVANTVHGHYYFTNSGHYKYDGFVDNIYANSNIRAIADGPFHLILKLHKVSGWN